MIEGLLALYASAPGLHRVLALEGLRVTPTDRVQAFDMRVVSVVRSFLAASNLPIRRSNLDAAAFVIFQSVRASMLARMLESPPGLDDETLTEELTDLVLRYLVDESAGAAQRLPEPRRIRPGQEARLSYLRSRNRSTLSGGASFGLVGSARTGLVWAGGGGGVAGTFAAAAARSRRFACRADRLAPAAGLGVRAAGETAAADCGVAAHGRRDRRTGVVRLRRACGGSARRLCRGDRHGRPGRRRLRSAGGGAGRLRLATRALAAERQAPGEQRDHCGRDHAEQREREQHARAVRRPRAAGLRADRPERAVIRGREPAARRVRELVLVAEPHASAREREQRRPELRRRLEAQRGILLHRARDHRLEGGRNAPARAC